MNRYALMGLLVVALAGNVGCSALDRVFRNRSCDSGCGASCSDDCNACVADNGHGHGHHGQGHHGLGHGLHARHHGPPVSGTVAYPYYTTRGPRDFLACNPGYPRN